MARLKAKEDLVNTYIDDRVKVLLPEFELLVTLKPTQRRKGGYVLTEDEGSVKAIGWAELALREGANLKAQYPDTIDEKTKEIKYNLTCVRQVTALKKALVRAAKTDLKNSENYNSVLKIINHFGVDLSRLFALYTVEKNKTQRAKVETRSTPENRLELDLSEYVAKASEVLELCLDGADLDEIEWRDVSCALALVTGRRMAEIHLSAEFEKVSDYEVSFKGQLKGKGRKVDVEGKEEKLRYVSFTIPTLVKADLVIAGLEWLGYHGKRFSKEGTWWNDTDRVNRRWSKVLSEKVKEEWLILPADEMTYHKFRGAYFRANIVNSNIDPMDYLNYARQILGDSDESTIRAYQRFEIKEGSLTKI